MLHQDKHQDKSVNIEEKLYSAILNDSADQVDFWLTAGANVHAIDSKGRTPLQYAVEIRRWNCVKVFLKHVKEKIPGEILREMILEGPEDIAKLMIQKGCELEENYSYKTGYHALHTAIYKKKFTVVEALLEHKVNPSLKTTVTSHNFKEVSPLELAVETNQPYMIRLLLKFASDATSSTYFGKKSLVSYAAENKFWDCVKVLVGASVLKDDYGLALKYATDYNNTSIACLLIESKADPHSSYGISNGFRTLHCAIEKGNCEIVASLLEHKANPNAKAQLTQSNAKDTTSLEVAIKNNQIRALQLLLDAGVDTSIKMTNSTSALIYAASLQYWDCVNQLLTHPKAKFSEDEYDRVLIYVVQHNQEELLKILLEKKVALDRYHFTDTGHYAIHLAVTNNKLRITSLLLAANADPLYKTALANENKMPQTALDMALKKGFKEITHLLMEKSKNQKLDEFLLGIFSYRDANEGMIKCLEEFQLRPQDVFQYIQQKKDHPAYFLWMLAFFNYNVYQKNASFVDLFKDVQIDGHRYVAKSLLEIFAIVANTNVKFYQIIPEICRGLLKLSEMENKKNESFLVSNAFMDISIYKNKMMKTVSDRVLDFKYLNFDKTIIHRIAVMQDVQDKIYQQMYDVTKIENKLKWVYGEDVFYSGFFDRNPLQFYIKQLNIFLGIKSNWELFYPPVTKEVVPLPPPPALAPPEYNPAFQEPEAPEEPGAKANPYLDMNFFEQKPLPVEGEPDASIEQIEGRKSF